jgi:hypothetical protein
MPQPACDIVQKKTVQKNLRLFAPVDDFRSHGTSLMKWCPGARLKISALPDGHPSKRQLRGSSLHSRSARRMQRWMADHPAKRE